MSTKRFRFSLDGVLHVRQHEAERAEQHLARALVERRAHEAAVEAARARLDGLLGGGPTGPASPVELRRLALVRQEAKGAVAAAHLALDAGRGRERAARTALADRRRAEEALTTLRRLELDAHRTAALAAEGAFLDDQAAAAHARKLRRAA